MMNNEFLDENIDFVNLIIVYILWNMEYIAIKYYLSPFFECECICGVIDAWALGARKKSK